MAKMNKTILTHIFIIKILPTMVQITIFPVIAHRYIAQTMFDIPKVP